MIRFNQIISVVTLLFSSCLWGGPAVSQTWIMTPTKNVRGIAITDTINFDKSLGYGFIALTGQNEKVFAAELPEGDYRVTVWLGDNRAPSRTVIWAEDRRLVAPPIALRKNEQKSVTFVVNIRRPTLVAAEQDNVTAPKVGLRGDEVDGRDWDDLLTLSFSGAAPAVRAIAIEPVTAPRILIAGDSTVADQAGGDYASWGQMLPRFVSTDWGVANYARSGETMKSFLTSLRFDKLLSQVRPNDVVLIQFGHNDQKSQWPRTYVEGKTTYKAYMTAYVRDIEQRGGRVVLVTPVSRRSFDSDGHIKDTLGDYDDAVRALGIELNLPVIDLNQSTALLYETLGSEQSRLAFGNNGKDGTHHNAYGALQIACYVASELGVRAIVPTQTPVSKCDPQSPIDPKNSEISATDWPDMRTNAAPKLKLNQ